LKKKKINKERENFDKINLNIEKLTSITEDAESKIDLLNSKINLLGEVEKRLSSLNLLAEDVNVKILNLKQEEKEISKAGEQITELRFLLSEVERKTDGSV